MSKIPRSAIALLAGILIFVGLPLLGWGLTDLPAFLDHPARPAYLILVVLLQLYVVIMIPEGGSSRGGEKPATSRQRLALLLLQLVPLAIVFTPPYSDRRDLLALGDLNWVRYLGLALFFLGFGGMHWAEAYLDWQFSVRVTVQKDHQLITDGPYRFLRHPRYLGILAFTAGIALVFRSGLALVLVAALALLLLWRIQDEEALMHQEFGARWEAYCRKSRRLIPFIY